MADSGSGSGNIEGEPVLVIWYHLFHPSSNTHSVALGLLAILEHMTKGCPFIDALGLGLSFG